jgi:serine/threonine protein kinase
VTFRDGLGERLQILDPTGNDALELLCLRPELAAVPSFEFALRERVSRLANFRHAYYARVRAVERLSDGGATLAVVSERTPGVRLSEMLASAEERKLSLDINTALCLIRQIVPAVEMLHESARDVAHGALTPERLIVTPHARVMITEYVLGAALEQLRYPTERYWSELRIPLATIPGTTRFNQRTDVAQLGMLALSLILGRALHEDEFPTRIPEVVASTWAVSARGGFEPLPPGLRAWLGRALQLDVREAFESAVDARIELDKVLGDSDYIASPASLEAFLARHHAVEKSGAASVVAIPPGAARPSSAPPQPNQHVPAPAPAAPTPAPGAPASLKTSDYMAPVTPPSPPPAATRAPLANPPQPVAPPRYEVHAEPEELDEQPPSRWRRIAAIAAALVVLAVGGVFAGRQYFTASTSETAAATGTLVISSNPPGADAFVDGQPRGVTPLTLELTPGEHTIELRGGAEPRTIPITITAGQQVAQYVEMPTASATNGQLQVRTEPAGVGVTVDGILRGSSPILVADLAPGEHIVSLENDLRTVKQVVTIEAGVTASLVVPMAAPEGAPVSGWIAVASPVDVQLWEQGRLIGTNLSERVMVSAGRHEIELVNDALGFRATRSVQVAAGKVASLKVDVPKGTLALNAAPWAEVWIDGERIGETPIGNLSLTIGRHDVLFRHPELGEHHHIATVTLKDVTRLSVDLRKR